MNTGIVRFICTLVVLAISSVSVVGSPKGPFITLDNENTLIREIAALLFRQARDQGIALRIGFDRDLLDRQVSVSFDTAPLHEVLATLRTEHGMCAYRSNPANAPLIAIDVVEAS